MNEPHAAQDGTCNAADVVVARAEIRCGDAKKPVDAADGYEEEIRLVDIEAEPDEDNLRELSSLSAKMSYFPVSLSKWWGLAYRGDGTTTDGNADEEEAEQPNPRVEQCLSKLIPLEGVVLDHHLIAAQTFDRVDLLVF